MFGWPAVNPQIDAFSSRRTLDGNCDLRGESAVSSPTWSHSLPTMDVVPMLVQRCRGASEAMLLAIACLTPWAYGGVEAWAEFVVFAGVVLVAILTLITSWGTDRFRSFTCIPALGLAGLGLLAAAQAAPLSPGVLRWIAPPSATLRAGLLPRHAERVSGDPRPPVPLPAATISQDPEASLRMAARLAAGWILFQGVLGLGRGSAPLRRFGAALAANATLLALFSLAQMLSWNGKIYWLRESPSGNAGPFVCHNHLAAYLNLGLGFALAFLFSPRAGGNRTSRGGARAWAAYASALIVVGIVASLSRSGFLAMAVALVVAIVSLRPRVQRLGLALAGLLVLVPVFLFALGSSAPYQERLSSLGNADAYSVRVQIWERAIRIWPIYPVWGTGLGSFSTASARFFLRGFHADFAHAENEYIEWLVEGGIVGSGLVLLAVVGLVRLARTALKANPAAHPRALMLGTLFGALTLAIHSMGDFALHIPAVAVVAVMIAAHVSKLGVEAEDPRAHAPATARAQVLTAVAGGTAVVLSLLVADSGYRALRSESAYARAGLEFPGRSAPAAAPADADLDRLERTRDALERALRYRPDWAEGHWRLGLTFLNLYERTAFEAFREFETDPAQATAKARVLWLFNQVHATSSAPSVPATELLAFEHVRLYLVPAARCFLEARRCCPVLSLPHARLATLDFLLEGDDPPSAYLERALRLAGTDRQLLDLAQTMAIQVRDLDLAARCWRRILSLGEPRWEPIADMAGRLLEPGEILDRVVPSGRHALWFAERLYADPEYRPIRDRFLREAIARLPSDADLSRGERLRLEAEAWSLLDDRDRAEDRMEQALALEPGRIAWRKELVEWLIAWGRVREAHDQALAAHYFAPDHPDARSALERAAEALARSPGAFGTPRASIRRGAAPIDSHGNHGRRFRGLFVIRRVQGTRSRAGMAENTGFLGV